MTMGVYIKDMEMPKNCASCPISVLSDNRLFCERTSNEVVRMKRDRDCPLVPVPPHGRLIDADELLPIYADLMDGGYVKPVIPKAVIDTVPTIIEAEGEE